MPHLSILFFKYDMRRSYLFSKIIFYNLIIFTSILLILELLTRVAYVTKRCILNKDCYENKHILTRISINPLSNKTYLGLSRYDDRLGYVPKENFDLKINNHLWNNKRVTINEKGFRVNSINDDKYTPKIITVGDSFTFGDQVSNEETWPSCVQRKSKMGVINGGVFGYGTGQALLRGLHELESEKGYEYLILSSLISDDFKRDRHEFSAGFPKPSLIKINDKVIWSEVSDKNKSGTKYNPKPNKIIKFLWQNSLLGSYIISKNNYSHNISGDMITLIHKNAASLQEVIDWSLIELSRAKVANKYLLLQYDSKDIDNPEVQRLRRLIKEKVKPLQLKVIDTYEKIQSMPETEVWIGRNGHHSATGNLLVCDVIMKELRENRLKSQNKKINL